VRGRCSIAVLTRGALGSVVLGGGEVHRIEPRVLGPLVDTTGAGDLYAAGFLYGLSRGEPLQYCGQLGSLCAGQVITQLGPRPRVSLPQLVADQLGAPPAAATAPGATAQPR
jgi:sugar/nucleoside kinase (ribokinase family)